MARNLTTQQHQCHVFRCDIAARGVARSLLDSHQQNKAKGGEGGGGEIGGKREGGGEGGGAGGGAGGGGGVGDGQQQGEGHITLSTQSSEASEGRAPDGEGSSTCLKFDPHPSFRSVIKP